MDIEREKVDIQNKKVDIERVLLRNGAAFLQKRSHIYIDFLSDLALMEYSAGVLSWSFWD